MKQCNSVVRYVTETASVGFFGAKVDFFFPLLDLLGSKLSEIDGVQIFPKTPNFPIARYISHFGAQYGPPGKEGGV